MFLIHALWFFVSVMVPLLLPLAYAGVGARVLTYAVKHRVPLKIAPGAGEWAVMGAYCTLIWPLALVMWPQLRPSLIPMNRRDRDRLAMGNEIDAMEDSVKFAATKEVHRAKMDELHAQLQQIEHSSGLRELEAANPEPVTEPVVLGFEAQKMLHMAEFTLDNEAYTDRYKIKSKRDDYNSSRKVYYKNHGCNHDNIELLLECSNCSPIGAALRVKKTAEREAAKARGAAAWDHGKQRATQSWDSDEIVDAELA